MTDIAHWPAYGRQTPEAHRVFDAGTAFAYSCFAIALAVVVAFPLGII